MRCVWAGLAICLLGSIARAQAPAPPKPAPPALAPASGTALAPASGTTAAPASGAATTPRPVAAKVKKKKRVPPPPPPPAAELFALNTHESFLLRPDRKGRFTRALLKGWNRFLRCHHTGRVH